jgi:hypothetical protein
MTIRKGIIAIDKVENIFTAYLLTHPYPYPPYPPPFAHATEL